MAGGVLVAACAPAVPAPGGGATSTNGRTNTSTAAPAAVIAPKRGGVMVTADFDDLGTFDPAQITNSTGRRISRALYDPLVELGQANNLVPALAEAGKRPIRRRGSFTSAKR